MSHHDLSHLLDRYRITDGRHFRLADHDPAETAGLDHPTADRLLAEGVARLTHLQSLLYAQDRWSLLCVLQALDAAGKDGVVKHVLSGVNPQGVQVTSFKAPGPEELAHDFLWRVHRAVPPRGHIGIFNRSHYEEVLVVRVHPAILDAQRMPPKLRGARLWDERLRDIRRFERYLARQGIVVAKIFLHLSPDEQKRRFLERLDDPAKHWKFSPADLAERAHWDAYMAAYEQAIRATARPHAPWYVVPANDKRFAHTVVVEALIHTLGALDLAVPQLSAAEEANLVAARARLLAEK